MTVTKTILNIDYGCDIDEYNSDTEYKHICDLTSLGKEFGKMSEYDIVYKWKMPF